MANALSRACLAQGAIRPDVPRRPASPGLQHNWKASFATLLTDGAIEAHLEHGPKVPVVNSTMHIYPINGACHRVLSDATAFAYRDATFATVVAGMWPDPTDTRRTSPG